jgi:hypothetical protein
MKAITEKIKMEIIVDHFRKKWTVERIAYRRSLPSHWVLIIVENHKKRSNG